MDPQELYQNVSFTELLKGLHKVAQSLCFEFEYFVNGEALNAVKLSALTWSNFVIQVRILIQFPIQPLISISNGKTNIPIK